MLDVETPTSLLHLAPLSLAVQLSPAKQGIRRGFLLGNLMSPRRKTQILTLVVPPVNDAAESPYMKSNSCVHSFIHYVVAMEGSRQDGPSDSIWFSHPCVKHSPFENRLSKNDGRSL